MRIRRRPSSSLNPDPSLQPPPKEERASGGLHPDGDLPDPVLQTLHPQHNALEVLKEEKIQVVDDTSSQQTLSFMHANGSGRGGSAAEVPFGVGLAWCNGESAVAVPRKRRGSRVGEDDTAKTKPVSSSNSIAPRNDSSNNNNDDDDAIGGTKVVVGEEGKRKKRGSPVLMEGSRCSRVNGRGWRCFQQTLVGYSLCEHHLGKGRLRSMSSVRGSKPGASTTTKHKNIVDDGASTANLAGEEEGETQQCLGGKKGRRKKIGTMKARSISTLLDETDHAAAAIISSLAVPVLEIDKRLV